MKSLADIMAEGITLARETGEAHTLVLIDNQFDVMRSQEYAVLHENNRDQGIVPMVSFLPGGGAEAARPAFQPLADAAQYVGTEPQRPNHV